MNIQRWMLERGRISCQRHTYTSCSDAERNVVSFCWESEGAAGGVSALAFVAY